MVIFFLIIIGFSLIKSSLGFFFIKLNLRKFCDFEKNLKFLITKKKKYLYN